MRKYDASQERKIRAKRLVDEWARSRLVDGSQRDALARELPVDLRRTNRFLRLTLFLFGVVIIGAAVGLVAVTLDVKDETTAGSLCLIAAAICAAMAEFLSDRFRLYRFGVEEAFACGAVVLTAAGSTLLIGNRWRAVLSNPALFVGLCAGAAGALLVYLRFSYVYAAVASIVCLAFVPFSVHGSESTQRLIAAAILGGCFAAARFHRQGLDDEFPGDQYGGIQAAAWLGLYAALNLHLDQELTRPFPAWFYWFTYAMIWILPAAGIRLSIRDRDRPLLDASLVMAVVTLATNKPYLHLARKPWDPMLLGVLLVAAAIGLRRWLAAGAGGSRQGFTAARILKSDQDAIAAAGLASAAFPHGHAPAPPAPDPPDPFQGGRSGGGGAGASF